MPSPIDLTLATVGERVPSNRHCSKATIEARAKERQVRELAAYEATIAAREAKTKATGKPQSAS